MKNGGVISHDNQEMFQHDSVDIDVGWLIKKSADIHGSKAFLQKPRIHAATKHIG